MELEWDPRKAIANRRKHGVDFADAGTVLHVEQAITISEESSDAERPIRHAGHGRARPGLVVVYTWRGDRPVRGCEMKKQYDFRHGRRGAVLRAPSGKTRITIRIDDDILEWFRRQVHKAGGGSYQTLINEALHTFAESPEQDLEDTLRRVLREELPRYRVQPTTGRTRR